MPQAYAIIRSLRPLAEHIVATVYGLRRLAPYTCHAAFSRLVDRRVRVPLPDRDWITGRIQAENTEGEEIFVRAILELCERERIDTIFPSADPWVYVFSKNRERFAKRGIVIPVPDLETVLGPMDKYRSIAAAQACGFPAPRSFLPEDEADVARITRELPPPWVIKPRISQSSAGLAIVSDAAELAERVRAVQARRGTPMIQEYIPGKEKQNFYLILDRDGELKSLMSPRILRYSRRLYRAATAACETAPRHEYADKAVALARQLGWWGGLTIQTKIDPRDGRPRLMEANPRLGAHLWYRTELDINEPAMCLAIARGEPVAPASDPPPGCRLLEPIEDIGAISFEVLDRLVYWIRMRVLGARPMDPSNEPMKLGEIVRAYWDQYVRSESKRYSPEFRHALGDPLPALIWLYRVLTAYAWPMRRELGR
jgi:biotin carboxylase